MKLIDLSREIYHKMPRLPNHPPIIITSYGTHDEIREADGYKFSTATMSLALGDHSGTHVDAPAHFLFAEFTPEGALQLDHARLARKALKRLLNGDEDNLAHYVETVVKTIIPSAAGKEARVVVR